MPHRAGHDAAFVMRPVGARQTHRWLSIAFTVGFLVNLAHSMTAGEDYLMWVGLLALIPLLLLMITGLYLFALPYLSKRKGQVDG